ncbi:helix-turn-helix domain-containing protein [Xanthomonas sacchari]|uniref:helix-turn-helix domain-containing protein n=1 Tax=Xanthomonas sacchari TaxID=56458 RepID=UPI00225E209C|nr:helix-turn-helix domain-containing protein [Xanthomonas sacchari]UYK82270.1 helix-turn-helix domain-containing protein [Xanthomonas sacchari]
MLLMTVHVWVGKYFAEGSAPTELTVRRWLLSGSLPGMKIGGTWYVDEHAWLAGGNELVLRVLEAG